MNDFTAQYDSDTQFELPGQMVPAESQIQNDAGGYVHALDIWGKLDRTLILGNDQSTYYVSKNVMAQRGLDTVREALATDGARTVKRIGDISVSGRAPKNDYAIKALALAASCNNVVTRQIALATMPFVCRTGTHLFQFCEYVQNERGWGRALKDAVANWYTSKSADDAAFQMAKYRQRNGWSHRDTLRLSHPVPPTAAHRALFRWATGKPAAGDLPVWAGLVDLLASTQDVTKVIQIITDYQVPWELVPTDFLGNRDVWGALLPNLPATALVRNLGRLGANGLLAPMSDAARTVVDKLNDQKYIAKGRLHPIAILSALRVYQQGHGESGNLKWDPVAMVTDALNQAFYTSFGSVKPSGERMLLALDVSDSMTWNKIAGVPGITPNVAAAAMALVTANVETNYHITAFSNGMVTVGISPKMRLDQVLHAMRVGYGGTDCAAPIMWALRRKIEVDKIVIYTDGNTWAGTRKVSDALNDYRQAMGIPLKLIQVAMEANEGSLNCPNDPLTLDVVGFDTATPSLVSSF